MKIEGNPKSQGPEARRFSARKAAPGDGGKTFGEALKKAAAGLPGAKAPADADTVAAKAGPDGSSSASVPPQTGSIQPAPEGEANPEAEGALRSKGAADAEPKSFESHMEMVKLRLKSGYYSSQKIDEALSDRLTGYFDDFA